MLNLYDQKLNYLFLKKNPKIFTNLKYTTFFSEGDDYLFLFTNFKKNFKYKITLMYKTLPLIFFNIKKKKSSILQNNVDKRKIYLSQQYLVLDLLTSYFEENTQTLFFFYKNISFLFMRYTYEFFKFFNDFNLPDYYFFFNFNFSFIHNKYFKKVKTKKKFRKKIFLKSFQFDFKETYIL